MPSAINLKKFAISPAHGPDGAQVDRRIATNEKFFQETQRFQHYVPPVDIEFGGINWQMPLSRAVDYFADPGHLLRPAS
jgi:hypothetical protein